MKSKQMNNLINLSIVKRIPLFHKDKVLEQSSLHTQIRQYR
jgi:hypothetical protein